MTTLAIDIETYSSVDLTHCGVYRYTEAPDFTILLLAYAFDDDPVEVIDLACGQVIPDRVMVALTRAAVIKTAYNAQFERTCLAKYLSLLLPPEQWRCSQAQALTLGLPGNLGKVAECLGLRQQKLEQGQSLVRYFSVPGKPGIPQHDVDKWQAFKAYCRQDVVVERELRQRLQRYPLTEKEQRLWCLDQRINDAGVLVDKVLVDNAIKCGAIYHHRLLATASQLTGLKNPNSATQLKGWLQQQHQIKVDNLAKEQVSELVARVKNPVVKKVLGLRQQMSKTSIKKYQAMERGLGKDGRIRGLMQFYGANRTGRWAGRLVQVHNLPRNTMPALAEARQQLKAGHYQRLEVLSQLVRTAFIPSPGCRFIVADFSAIEARVIAWLAGERWRLDIFNGHGKIYEASAAQMFGVPLEAVSKGSGLREKGKIAELALGYQGSTGALLAMGALKMGLKEEELPRLVAAWRLSNPNIVKLWRQVEKAALTAVRERCSVPLAGLKFYCQDDMLFISLSSGRNLAYQRPRVELDARFKKEKLTYEGVEQGTKRWGRISTYGGKLVENIVQAIARDCLAEAMLRLDVAGYRIVFHVHDEVILDVPRNFGSLTEVAAVMGLAIDWAPGLPLRAEAFEADYYMKN